MNNRPLNFTDPSGLWSSQGTGSRIDGEEEKRMSETYSKQASAAAAKNAAADKAHWEAMNRRGQAEIEKQKQEKTAQRKKEKESNYHASIDTEGRNSTSGVVKSADFEAVDWKPDIRDYINSGDPYTEVQSKVPVGYDVIWATGIEGSIGAAASFMESGGILQFGLLGVEFYNCNTKENYEASFRTLTHSIEGYSLSAGASINIYGGFGLFEAGASEDDVITSFMSDQGPTKGKSILFIGGARSESSTWTINQINLGATTKNSIPVFYTSTWGSMELISKGKKK